MKNDKAILTVLLLFIERQKIRSKGLVQEPGLKKLFGYRAIHQNSLTSCPGQRHIKMSWIRIRPGFKLKHRF